MLRLLSKNKFRKKNNLLRYKLARYFRFGNPHYILFSLFFSFLALIFLIGDPGLKPLTNNMLYFSFLIAAIYFAVNFCQDFRWYLFKNH